MLRELLLERKRSYRSRARLLALTQIVADFSVNATARREREWSCCVDVRRRSPTRARGWRRALHCALTRNLKLSDSL